MDFETVIEGYGDIDVIRTDNEFITGQVKVKWSVQVETRSWGVKSISAYATSATADLTFIENGEEKEITIKDGEDGWKLESELKLDDDSITTNNANIDFQDKVITIS